MSKKLAEVAEAIQNKYAETTYRYPDFETGDALLSATNLVQHLRQGAYISENMEKIFLKDLKINGVNAIPGIFLMAEKLLLQEKIEAQKTVKSFLERITKVNHTLDMLKQVKPSMVDRRKAQDEAEKTVE